MRTRAVLMASCCLLLGGCGPQLAGMPRIIAAGGVVPGGEVAQVQQRNEAAAAERSRRRQALLDQNRITEEYQQQLEAQQLALQRLQLEGLQQQLASDEEQQRRPQQQQQQQQQQPSPQAAREAENARRQALAEQIRTLNESIAAQRQELQRQRDRQAQLLTDLEQTAPARSDAPAHLEPFRDRFIRLVLEAQVNDAPPEAIERMMSSGYLLVRSGCDDFFSDAAILQRDADISRDMFAPILSLLTGIVALRNVAQEDSDRLTQIFNLAANTGLAGISLVDKHFLFGSENIHQVRDLTFDALDAKQEYIESLGELDYPRAMEELIKFQVVCTPSSILRLTRDAIGAGTVEADINAGPTHDEQVLERLASELGQTGTLNDHQALALWKLYRNGAPEDNLPAGLDTELSGLGLGDLVVAAVAASPGVAAVPAKLSSDGLSHRGDIYRLLGTFSPAARRSLAQRATGDAVRAAGGPRALGGPAGVDEPFRLPSTPSNRRRGRLTVH